MSDGTAQVISAFFGVIGAVIVALIAQWGANVRWQAEMRHRESRGEHHRLESLEPEPAEDEV